MLYRFALIMTLVPPTLASSVYATELDKVIIKSSAQTSMHDITQPVLVIDETALRKSQATSLGELLEQQPGVSNASFGPGVGRPVLRGLSGNRVKTMVNGHDSSDLAAMSSDHAPMAEIANAYQVEVVQGPATVLYGSGAIGGVVNVFNKAMHRTPIYDTEGSLKAGVSNNGQAQSYSAELDSGNGNWAVHLDAFHKSSGDYHSGKTTIKNSDTQASGGTIGISKTSAKNGFIAASIGIMDQEYGVPNEDDNDVRVRPKQIRSDITASWLTPMEGIKNWETSFSYVVYEHDELTGNKIEGLFEKETIEVNSKLHHASIWGWSGIAGVHLYQKDMKLCHDHTGCDGIPNYSHDSWSGNQGNLFTVIDGLEFVHDTPMPMTKTQDIGYFLSESTPWNLGSLGKGLFELGARIDFRTIEADPNSISISGRRSAVYYDDKYFMPMTFSAASTWFVNDAQKLSISLARAQRAPDADELYWNGDHHATFSYQLDNIDLKEETAYTADIIWNVIDEHYLLRTAIYYYQFDDFIYNDLKNTLDPYHNHVVYRQEQKNAEFTGFEFSWEQRITDTLSTVFNMDAVKAELTEGSDKYIPRVPPMSASLQVNWQKNAWAVRAENHWAARQSAVARNESESAEFQRFDVSVDYTTHFSQKELITSLGVKNLFNELSTNHVSYLKEYAPNSGRNIQLQTQLYF